MSTAPLSRKVIVRNPLGLHMRPARELVELASQFESKIELGLNGEVVDCKSILSLITLGAGQGTELALTAQGDDAEVALQSIHDLFEAGFNEPNEMTGA